MNNIPIRSGVTIIDFLFDLCGKVLLWLADLFGVSYNTINIWIFCIIWPILTLALVVVTIRQHLKIKKLCKS